jgi:hypothetical protein
MWSGKRILVNFELYKYVITLLIKLTRTLKNNHNSCRCTHETTKNNGLDRIKLWVLIWLATKNKLLGGWVRNAI